MCGIAGIVGLNAQPIEPFVIKRMCDAIAHRGPDDAGYAFFRSPNTEEGLYCTEFCDSEFRHANEHLPPFGGSYFADEVHKIPPHVALGHRRLSIIDLTHYGHQPMANTSRRLWITFNGEIYNYQELRDELVAKGHLFRTRTDTEVILHIWEEYGRVGLSKLDGMFALAVYDLDGGKLTLARDRFGVKPLYYAFAKDELLFGSEVKAVLASGRVPKEFEGASVVEYLTFQNLFGDRTLFRGVHLLGPGEFLEVAVGRSSLPVRGRHSELSWEIDHELTDDAETEHRTSELFTAAVKRQLVGDVEIGAYLSGGMDSGSITAVAGRSRPRLLTFTAGFDLTNVDGLEQGYDERKSAEKLSYLLQTEHYDVVLHAGDMPAVMERLTWHMDDPRVGMCHQNWYVAKLASRFVKVCLAGAGGDELFGGYPWRYRRVVDSASYADFDDAYFRYWHRLLPPEEMPSLLSGDLVRHTADAEASFRAVMARAPANDRRMTLRDNLMQRALYFEFHTFMQGFLVTEDRISMAHSLETRVPFLDNALAQAACRMHPRMKVRLDALAEHDSNEPMLTADGKRVLRKAMAEILPREFTEQRKQGFSSPDANWYRGPSMDYIRTILFDHRSTQRPWFQKGAVERVLQEHFDGRRNHRLLIWSLLSLEWLQRHYTDQVAQPALRLNVA